MVLVYQADAQRCGGRGRWGGMNNGYGGQRWGGTVIISDPYYDSWGWGGTTIIGGPAIMPTFYDYYGINRPFVNQSWGWGRPRGRFNGYRQNNIYRGNYGRRNYRNGDYTPRGRYSGGRGCR